MCLYGGVVCASVIAYGGKKRALDSLELKSLAVVNQELNLGLLWKSVHALNYCGISPALSWFS